MYRFLVVLLLLQFSTNSQTDRTGAIIFLSEKDVRVHLNSTKIMPSKNLIPLKEGKYKISSWAPTYELLNDTFTVFKGKTRFYTPHLKHTSDFKIYRLKKIARASAIILPGALMVFSAGFYYKKHDGIGKDIEQARYDALFYKENYETSFSPTEFEYYKSRYNDQVLVYNDLIKKQQDVFQKGKIVFSALGATTICSIIWNCLSKKPILKENVLLARIEPSYNVINNQLCLIVKL